MKYDSRTPWWSSPLPCWTQLPLRTLLRKRHDDNLATWAVWFVADLHHCLAEHYHHWGCPRGRDMTKILQCGLCDLLMFCTIGLLDTNTTEDALEEETRWQPCHVFCWWSPPLPSWTLLPLRLPSRKRHDNNYAMWAVWFVDGLHHCLAEHYHHWGCPQGRDMTTTVQCGLCDLLMVCTIA